MRTLLGPIAFIALIAAPAHGADRQAWGFVKSGDMAQLVYGVSESDLATILFRCEGAPRRIEIVSTVLPAKPKLRQAARTTLSSGTASAAYDGTIGQDADEGGFHFIASAQAAPQVIAVLKSGRVLTIGIAGRQKHLPLRGISGPLAQFEAACFGKS